MKELTKKDMLERTLEGTTLVNIPRVASLIDNIRAKT